jgi:ribonuclease HI
MNYITCDGARCQAGEGYSGWAAGLEPIPGLGFRRYLVGMGYTISSMEAELNGLLLALQLCESSGVGQYRILTDCLTFVQALDKLQKARERYGESFNLGMGIRSCAPKRSRNKWRRFVRGLITLQSTGFDVEVCWEQGHPGNPHLHSARYSIDAMAKKAMQDARALKITAAA